MSRHTYGELLHLENVARKRGDVKLAEGWARARRDWKPPAPPEAPRYILPVSRNGGPYENRAPGPVRRYMVFACGNPPNGGLGDYVGDSDELQEAIDIGQAETRVDGATVTLFDTEEHCVFSFGPLALDGTLRDHPHLRDDRYGQGDA